MAMRLPGDDWTYYPPYKRHVVNNLLTTVVALEEQIETQIGLGLGQSGARACGNPETL
jgi:hypothetical protein